MLIISPSCYNYFFDLSSCLCMYIVLGISSLPSSNRRTPLPIEKHAPAYWNPFNSITHRHNLKRISIRGEGRAGQGRAGRCRGGQLSSWWPAAPAQCPPFLPSLPLATFHLRLLPTFLHGTWAGLRLIALVCSCTTRLSAACNMYLPFFSLSAPCQSSVSISCSCPCQLSPLYMLELSLKRLAILLDCAVVLKTRRIAPVCIWGGQPAPPSLSQPFPLHSPPPGQAEIYAHMLSTVFALKRECRGQNVGPFLGLALHSFAGKDMRRVAAVSPLPSLHPALLYRQSVRASFRLLWHFSYAFLLVF